MAERTEIEARNFTPFTPFSSFCGQALIFRRFAVVRMHRRGRICSLFSNAYRLPKLDVASSNLVSRSIFIDIPVGRSPDQRDRRSSTARNQSSSDDPCGHPLACQSW